VFAAVGEATASAVKIAAARLAITPFPPITLITLGREGKEAVSAW